MNMTDRMSWVRLGLVGALLPLAACGDLLDVSSPGRIADEDLNNLDAMPALVTGMSFDLAQGIDSGLQEIVLASGDLWHSGSYDFADIPRGIILPEDVDGMWGSMQQARWVAESGIERMQEVMDDRFETSALSSRAYLLAGFANRFLGENICEAVIDGGAAQSHTVHFDRAIDQFTRAIEIGQRANATALVTAAYGGRASMKAWKGDWAGAVADAQQVPVDFSYDAQYQLPDPANDLAYETTSRKEFTVFNTRFEDHPDDPRAPWKVVYLNDGSVAAGQNGATPFYQQLKYVDQASDIPLVKGTEMLVLRAEAALRDGDVAGAFALLNQARAAYGMDPLAVPGTLDEAWDTLHYERGATVWLEGRALWDMRRWYAESGPAHHDFLEGRDKCIPISKEERDSNPNLAR